MHVITKKSALVFEMVITDIHSPHKNPILDVISATGAANASKIKIVLIDDLD